MAGTHERVDTDAGAFAREGAFSLTRVSSGAFSRAFSGSLVEACSGAFVSSSELGNTTVICVFLLRG